MSFIGQKSQRKFPSPRESLDTSNDNQDLEKKITPRASSGQREGHGVQRLVERVVVSTMSKSARTMHQNAVASAKTDGHLTEALNALAEGATEDAGEAVASAIESLQPVLKRHFKAQQATPDEQAAKTPVLIQKLCSVHFRDALPKLSAQALNVLETALAQLGESPSKEVALVMVQLQFAVKADVLRRLADMLEQSGINVETAAPIDLGTLPESALHAFRDRAIELSAQARYFPMAEGDIAGTHFTPEKLKAMETLAVDAAVAFSLAKQDVPKATEVSIAAMPMQELARLKNAVDALASSGKAASKPQADMIQQLFAVRLAFETSLRGAMQETDVAKKAPLLAQAGTAARAAVEGFGLFGKKPGLGVLASWIGDFVAREQPDGLADAEKDLSQQAKSSDHPVILVLNVSVKAVFLRQALDAMESRAMEVRRTNRQDDFTLRKQELVDLLARLADLIALVGGFGVTDGKIPGTAFALKDLQALEKRTAALLLLQEERPAIRALKPADLRKLKAAVDVLRSDPQNGDPDPKFLKRLSDQIQAVESNTGTAFPWDDTELRHQVKLVNQKISSSVDVSLLSPTVAAALASFEKSATGDTVALSKTLKMLSRLVSKPTSLDDLQALKRMADAAKNAANVNHEARKVAKPGLNGSTVDKKATVSQTEKTLAQADALVQQIDVALAKQPSL